MKIKITIMLLITCISCHLAVCQNKVDTTAYYMKLENKNFKRAIEFCISDFSNWNLENYHNGSVIAIKINQTNVNECVLTVSQIFTMSDIFQNLPDNYSYLNGRPILWIFGRSILCKPDSSIQKFIIQHFSQYVFNNLVYDNSFDLDNPNKISNKIIFKNSNNGKVKKDSLLNGVQSSPNTIPADIVKNLKPTNINGPNEIINSSPEFIIKMKGDEISIEKKQKVYQKSVKLEN